METGEAKSFPSQVNIVINGHLLPGLISGVMANKNGVSPSVAGTPIHVTSPQSVTQSPRVSLTPHQREMMRLERERIKLEREKLRADIKAQKDAEKKAKMEEKEQKKREKIAKKEKEERERLERSAYKQAEKQRKLKEKEEARQLKERERESQRQLAEAEKLKAKERFLGFFNKTKVASNSKGEISQTMNSPTHMDSAQLHSFEELVHKQTVPSDYLQVCKHRPHRLGRKQATAAADTIQLSSPGNESSDVVILDSDDVKTERFKLLQFHDNHRPAYFGTWRKKSSKITPRNPFKKDHDVFDYECDSDLEWEEEEPGESLSNSEDEGAESGEDEEEEDGFFVPHGYLSDGEGDQSDGEKEKGNDKCIAKAKAWEAEFSRQFKQLVPVKVGVVWSHPPSSVHMDETFDLLVQFAAVALVPKPIKIGPRPFADSNTPVPDEALTDLVRLVHCSNLGVKKLVDSFQRHWTIKTNSSNCSISKKWISSKIGAIATKETRPPSLRPLWYVHEDVLCQLGLEGNKMSPLQVIESPAAVQSSTKKPVKRSHEETTPSMKPLQEFFKTPPLSSRVNVNRCLDLSVDQSDSSKAKRLKLTPPPVDVILIDNSMDDMKENHQPTDMEIVDHRHDNAQSDNRHDNGKELTQINWEKCLSESHKLSVPFDCHL